MHFKGSWRHQYTLLLNTLGCIPLTKVQRLFTVSFVFVSVTLCARHMIGAYQTSIEYMNDWVRSKHKKKEDWSVCIHESGRTLCSLQRAFCICCLDSLKIKFLPPYFPFNPLRVYEGPHIPVLEYSFLRGKTLHSQKPGRGNLLGKWGQNKSMLLFLVWLWGHAGHEPWQKQLIRV